MKVNVTYLLNLNIITKSLFMGIAIFWLVLGGGMVCDVCADIPPEERKALIALYNSTDGDNWRNMDEWKEPPLHTDGFAMPGTESNWYGITLDAAGTTVEKIDLYDNNLRGTISPELGNLSNLQRLLLYQNELTGSIPSQIGDLSHLLYLHLGDNQLTGSIPPEIGNLTNLEEISLGSNQLTGSIPSEIGNLTSLMELYLSWNQLTGSIPTEIGTLSNLQYLYLEGNQLTGTIPTEIGNLTNLVYLYLASNELTGSIPPEIGNLTNLVRLRLCRNHLTESIPPEIGNLTNLVRLYLNSNDLTGSIPTSLTDLVNLSDTATDIGYNALYTDDDTLRVFLNSKDPDWEDTQTIASEEVSATTDENTGGTEDRDRRGGGCFIATAAFGTTAESHVGILMDFRDQYLHSCQFGRKFISTYYKYSPPVAHFISKHETLRAVVRIGLLPLIAVSYAMLHFGPTLTLTIIAFLLIPPIFLVSFHRSRLRS